MNLFKKRRYWWEEDEEKREPVNRNLREELEYQFQNPIHDKLQTRNPFANLDTSNMNLRQELEAKFKALNDNNKTYPTQVTPNLFQTSNNDNVLEDEKSDYEKYRDFSYLNNAPLHMGLTAQQKQTPIRNLDTRLIKSRNILKTLYSDNVLKNDCYQSKRFKPFAEQIRKNEGENRGIIYATPEMTGVDQNTKYGISQNTLDLYRNKFKDIENSYPADVKDLTEDQAMNLICQFYKESRAEAINDANLAFAVFDSYFNSPIDSPKDWQQALRDKSNPDMQIGGGIGSQTINAFNQFDGNKEDLYNLYLKYHLPKVDRKYRKGITNRTRRYR